MSSSSRPQIGLLLYGPLLFSCPLQASGTFSIEVFTATGYSVSGEGDDLAQRAIVTIYRVDALERFESTLSEGLPADAEAAKVQALRRIRHIDDDRTKLAKNAAIGLATAVEYGVDRYPAVVFDGRAVVYGVTDLLEAIYRYDTSQQDQER